MAEPTMFQRFVSWARNNGYDTTDYNHGRFQFMSPDTQRAWHVWQAADASARLAHGVKAWTPPVDMDGETVTPQRLIAWLETKFKRHGEEEDQWAADYIRATCGVKADEPVAWLVPMLNDKPRLFTDQAEARSFCSKQNGMVYPQPLIVAPGYPYRNAGVNLGDNSPVLQCTFCGRKSWTGVERGLHCNMPQPDGSKCIGTMIPPLGRT